MATKIYLAGGAVNIEGVLTETLIINPAHFDYQKKGSNYFARDGIENTSYDLGVLANIEDKSGTVYASESILIAVLNSFSGQKIPYGLNISMGNVAGSKMYSITGKKDTISSAVLDDLSEIPSTTVIPSPGGIQLELVSSSLQDSGAGGVNPAGTGARSIEIHYLDDSNLEQNETVIMDGTTPVDTVATNINFVQWIHTKTLGSGSVTVGNISLKDTAGSVTYEYITAGGNQSLSGKYKVPANKIGYIQGWQGSAFTQRLDLRLRATVERSNRALIPEVFLFQDILVLKDNSSGWIPFSVPLKMPSLSVIKMSGLSSAANADGAGQFDILIVDEF